MALERVDTTLEDLLTEGVDTPMHPTRDQDEPGYVEGVLEKTSDFYKLARAFDPYIDNALKNPFIIQGKELLDSNTLALQSTALPISIAAFENIVIEAGEEPPNFPSDSGYKVYREVRFGYQTSDRVDTVGFLDYIVINQNGEIIMAGARSEEVKKIFLDHLRGRDLSESEGNKIKEVNDCLITELREDIACRYKLDKFLRENRKHEDEWSDIGKFAYFNPPEFSLKSFKQKYGFTNADLHAAGIMTRTISKEGQISYRPRSGGKDGIILIPFFDNDGGIINWRIRKVSPGENEPKYLSSPLDRSIKNLPVINAQLYSAHLLKKIEGKDVIFTEGEFKCHVTNQKAEVITFGMLGITMVTPQIIQAIINAKPKSVTIVLDNDSKAKGMKRVDERSDAERFTYTIAKWFQKLGYESVKCGTIETDASGEKAGIDDMQLPLTKDNAAKAVKRIIKNALTPEAYAEKLGLDPILHELLERRRLVSSTVENFKWNLKRGNPAYVVLSDEEKKELNSKLQSFESDAKSLEKAYRVHVARTYGAYRLNQPSMQKYYTLFSGKTPREKNKSVVRKDGLSIPLEKFSSDVVCFVGFPSDLPSHQRPIESPGLEVPFSMREITRLRYAKIASEDLKKIIINGAKALKAVSSKAEITEDDFSKLIKGLSQRTLSLYALAGHIANIYPLDEYQFHINVSLIISRDSYREHYATIPLLVQKKNGTTEAIISMPTWEDSMNIRGDKTYGITNSHRASEDDSRRRAAIRAFLRDPELVIQRGKSKRVANIILRYGEARNYKECINLLAPLGISDSQIRRRKITLLKPLDFRHLIGVLDNKDLLLQAVQAGYFSVEQDGYIKPRFKGPVLLLPIYQEGRVSMRVIPTKMSDHNGESLPPAPKVCHLLHGSRSAAASLDPATMIFGGNDLKFAKGKVVLIAYDELDALVLSSQLRERKDCVVVSFGSDLHPRSNIITEIKKANASRVIMVGGNIPEARSRYRDFEGGSVPTFIMDLYDLARRFRTDDSENAKGIELEYVPFNTSIANYVRQTPFPLAAEIGKEIGSNILNGAAPIISTIPKVYGYNGEAHRQIVRMFLKDLEELEEFLYTKNNYIGEKLQRIENLIDRIPKRYIALRNYFKSKGIFAPETFEDFCILRYRILPSAGSLYESFSLKELFQRRGTQTFTLPKPLYRRGMIKNLVTPEGNHQIEGEVLFQFGKDPVSSLNTLPFPINQKWYDLVAGQAAKKAEARLIRHDQVSKLNNTMQNLYALGVTESTRARKLPTYSVKKVSGTDRWECTWSVDINGNITKFTERGFTKNGAKHKSAKTAYEGVNDLITSLVNISFSPKKAKKGSMQAED